MRRWVILSIGALVALVVGRQRRARAASIERAEQRETTLRSARLPAVAQDRRALARELHYIASHAVSLVAVQAGAAELEVRDRVQAVVLAHRSGIG